MKEMLLDNPKFCSVALAESLSYEGMPSYILYVSPHAETDLAFNQHSENCFARKTKSTDISWELITRSKTGNRT